MMEQVGVDNAVVAPSSAVAAPSAAQPSAAQPSAAWYALAVLFCVNMFAFVDRMAIALLQEQIKAELHISDSQMGLILGLAFALCYSILGVPIARIADRASRPKLLAACLVTWSAMTAISGHAVSFLTLFLARVGVGVGEAGCLPAGHALIGEVFPRHRRTIALTIFQSGSVVGASLGLMIVGVLGQYYGWRVALQAIAIAAVPLVLLLVLTVREPRTAQAAAASREPAAKAFGALLRRPTFVHLTIGYSLVTVCTQGVVQWLPAFLMRSFHMTIIQVGAWSGIASFISGMGGLLIGGFVVTGLALRNPRWELWLPMAATALAIPFYAMMFLSSSAWMAIVLKVVAQFLAAMAGGVTMASVQSFSEPWRRATAISLVGLVSSFVGQGMGPVLIGWLSDLLAPLYGQESLRYALFVSCVMLGWGVVHYYLAARTSERDRVN